MSISFFYSRWKFIVYSFLYWYKEGIEGDKENFGISNKINIWGKGEKQEEWKLNKRSKELGWDDKRLNIIRWWNIR